MSNMSYCRFENTLHDLLDCQEELKLLFQRGVEGELPTQISEGNTREREARIKLIELVLEMAEMIEDERVDHKENATVEELVRDAEWACEEVRNNMEEEEED